MNKLIDRYSRKWMLYAGNNHELYEFRGHEREATEVFARYSRDSANDKFTFYTDDLNALPAVERLDAITKKMTRRWKVLDKARGYDKMKLVLAALECFAEMLTVNGETRKWTELTAEGQDTFLEYCDALVTIAGRVFHDHPDAVAGMIRAAAIADLVGAHDKCANILRIARVCTSKLHECYSFGQPEPDAEPHLIPFKPEKSYYAGLQGDTPWHERRRDWVRTTPCRFPKPKQNYIMPSADGSSI